MRDAIEMIVKSLVDDKETVDIREVEQRNGATLIEVRVAPQDIGKIIGKQGKHNSRPEIFGKNRRHKAESTIPPGNRGVTMDDGRLG